MHVDRFIAITKDHTENRCPFQGFFLSRIKYIDIVMNTHLCGMKIKILKKYFRIFFYDKVLEFDVFSRTILWFHYQIISKFHKITTKTLK